MQGGPSEIVGLNIRMASDEGLMLAVNRGDLIAFEELVNPPASLSSSRLAWASSSVSALPSALHP
jgi:hypothetical protein